MNSKLSFRICLLNLSVMTLVWGFTGCATSNNQPAKQQTVSYIFSAQGEMDITKATTPYDEDPMQRQVYLSMFKRGFFDVVKGNVKLSAVKRVRLGEAGAEGYESGISAGSYFLASRR